MKRKAECVDAKSKRAEMHVDVAGRRVVRTVLHAYPLDQFVRGQGFELETESFVAAWISPVVAKIP